MNSNGKFRALPRDVVPTALAALIGMSSFSAYADVSLDAKGTDGKVSLSWTTTDNLRAVQVMRDTDANPVGRKRLILLSAKVRSYTDTTVTNGRQYWYWIKYTNTSGVTADSASATAKPVGSAPQPIAVSGVAVSPANSSVVAGATATLSATVQPSNASNKSVTWSTSNAGVATVSTTGVITGVAAGQATITAKTADGGRTASSTVTVSAKPDAVVNYTLAIGVSGSGSTNLSGSQSYKSGTAVTVTATPASGSVFSGWSGAFTGNTNPLTVTMNGNKTLTAMFTKIPAPPPSAGDGSCPDEMLGFATVHADGVNGTTGGGDATPTRVTTLADLKAAAQDSKPRVIMVSGTIDTGSSALSIASNKTIIGADKNATIKGGLNMQDVSNIIIRNLNIQGKRSGNSPADTIASRNSHHIWYDHLNIWDAGDGLLDITIESNYQTVSWSKFWYSSANDDHRFASLNGAGGGAQPKDYGKMKTTYHHNWWGNLVDQRMPRLMYGQGHNFNNFFNSPGNSYCIGVGSYGSVLIENNYFKDVRNPHQYMYNVYMYSAANGNIYDNTSGTRDTGHGGSEHVSGQESYRAEPFTPPYKYTLDAAKDVPDLVKRCAGPQ